MCFPHCPSPLRLSRVSAPIPSCLRREARRWYKIPGLLQGCLSIETRPTMTFTPAVIQETASCSKSALLHLQKALLISSVERFLTQLSVLRTAMPEALYATSLSVRTHRSSAHLSALIFILSPASLLLNVWSETLLQSCLEPSSQSTALPLLPLIGYLIIIEQRSKNAIVILFTAKLNDVEKGWVLCGENFSKYSLQTLNVLFSFRVLYHRSAS